MFQEVHQHRNLGIGGGAWAWAWVGNGARKPPLRARKGEESD